MRRSYLIAPIALISVLSASPAAAQVAGIDAIKEWNLIVLGDLDSQSDVDGRTFVGGNLTGNSSNYQTAAGTTPSSRGTPGLTVVGDVTGSHKNLNNGSGAVVGGNVTSGFNLNGGQTVQVGGTIAGTNVNTGHTVNANLNTNNPQFRVDLEQQKSLLSSSLTGLSANLGTLTGNSQLVINGNKGVFNAVPDADKVAVFNITSADLDRIGEIEFNLNGATSAIINVTGTNITLNDNFLGDSNGLGNKLIWNFPEASTLTSTTAWKGTVLAPNATATTYNMIDGSAIFASLTQRGKISGSGYTGSYVPPSTTPTIPDGGDNGSPTPVPEEAFGLFALGALGLGGLYARRRRKQKAA